MTMTPEQIRNHVGEVWEDDDGVTWRLIAIDGDDVIYRNQDNRIKISDIDDWLIDNNLPQSLRKPSPRMVKAPGWRVWYGDDNPCEGSIGALTEDEARKSAEKYIKYVANVAIQAPGSDEMEVVKGFGND